MSSTRKQQIRPRFVDLAEFDDEQFAPASSASVSASASHQASNAFNWPSAATVVRKPPPTIGSSREKVHTAPSTSASSPLPQSSEATAADPPAEVKRSSKAKVVRIAPDSATQTRDPGAAPVQPSGFDQRNASTSTSTHATAAGSSETGFSFGPSSQPTTRRAAAVPDDDDQMPNRFTLDLNEGGQSPEGSGWGSRGPVEAGAPLIGSISERRPHHAGTSRPDSEGRPKSKSGSRFMASRQMDSDIRSASESKAAALARAKVLDDQAPGTGFPLVSRRDVVDPILPRRPGQDRLSDFTEDTASTPAPSTDRDAQRTASVQGQADEDEEWLDEGGRPMSAFRKSRLLKQGLRPPAVRKRGSAPTQSSLQSKDMTATIHEPDADAGYVRDPTRDPGGGADPESITAMLASVSDENDKKIRSMDAAEVEEELKSLEALFGKNVLEALRARKPMGNGSGTAVSDAAAVSTKTEVPVDGTRGPIPPFVIGQPGAIDRTAVLDQDGPDSIRRRYFPGEPEGPNPSLEWMMPASTSKTSTAADAAGEQPAEPRFDFEGLLVRNDVDTDKSYVSGLHHHGDDQEAPGYTTAELLHLVRSSVAAQRQLALNVLGRICFNYPSMLRGSLHVQDDAATRLPFAERATIQARTLISARWLLQDRHFTVRSAALRCLASVLRSGPAGDQPVQGADLVVDWKQLGLVVASPSKTSSEPQTQKMQRDRDSMSFEDIVKTDWVDFLIGSGFLDLCLEKTDTLVSSSWDAEMLLEILWRMASCSAERARRVVGGPDRQTRDLIVDLGLKTAWPPAVDGTAASPVPTSESWPSLSAVRLLHLGVLGDRETAKTMVLEGTVDHLMRFIMLYPWKLDEDVLTEQRASAASSIGTKDGSRSDDQELVLRAYHMFAACLDVYISLGRYGQYASVAGRTWSVWQDVGTWVIRFVRQELLAPTTPQQQEGATAAADLRASKAAVAERYFRLLEVWTVCAKDPHQLLSHHDITWTQVRDWVDVSCDALPSLAAAVASTSNPAVRGSSRILAGAIAGHLAAWIDCARGKQPSLLVQKISIIRTALQEIEEPFCRIVFDPDVFDGDSAASLRQMASLCVASSSVLRLSNSLADRSTGEQGSTKEKETRLIASFRAVAWKLLASPLLWTGLESKAARADGCYSYRSAIVNLVAQTIPAESEETARPDAAQAVERLTLVPCIGSTDRALLDRIIGEALSALVGIEGAAVLRPFLNEYVSGGHANSRRDQVLARSRHSFDVHPSSERLRSSLFYSELVDTAEAIRAEQPHEVLPSSDGDEGKIPVDEQDEATVDGEEVDPITKTPFWRSPASSLPLRADWALLAIDDVLHSANTAVFNRADNLDSDWRASERDIVDDSLRLAVDAYTALLQAYHRAGIAEQQPDGTGQDKQLAIVRALVTPEQIWLAVSKVFMLEKDQAESFIADKQQGRTAATGALTGRDLFRDPDIQRSIAQLLDLADSLVEIRSTSGLAIGTDPSAASLESWTHRTLGPDASFYQFFTDLLGLYDSVSFGDANFGRLVMTLTSSAVALPVDYRRLLWNDYRDALHTIRIRTGEVGVKTRWWDGAAGGDEDDDMLLRYAQVLSSLASQGDDRRSFVTYRVALWHCARRLAVDLFGEAEGQSRGSGHRRAEEAVATLARAGGAERVLHDLVRYDWRGEQSAAGTAMPYVDGARSEERRRVLEERLGIRVVL